MNTYLTPKSQMEVWCSRGLGAATTVAPKALEHLTSLPNPQPSYKPPRTEPQQAPITLELEGLVERKIRGKKKDKYVNKYNQKKKTLGQKQKGEGREGTLRSFPRGRQHHAITQPTQCKHMGEPMHAQTKVTSGHGWPQATNSYHVATTLQNAHKCQANANRVLIRSQYASQMQQTRFAPSY